MLIEFVKRNKIENENWNYVEETITHPKSRKQSKATNGSSTLLTHCEIESTGNILKYDRGCDNVEQVI